MHPGVEVHSLWELIDSDPAFSFADHHELKAYIQDCWRSRDRKDEQDAVRSLMKKMNIDIMELSGSREKTDFCGVSLYSAQPPRNPKLAPKHYVAGAAGKFIPQPGYKAEYHLREEAVLWIKRSFCQLLESIVSYIWIPLKKDEG